MVPSRVSTNLSILKSGRWIGYFAEFSRNGEDGFGQTILDYSHPQDPTTTSLEMRKNASRHIDLETHNDMNLSSDMLTDPGEQALGDSGGPLQAAHPRTSTLDRSWVEYLSGPCTTVRKREDFWNAWRAGMVPGVIAREIDERCLRAELILSSYCRFGDPSNMHGARAVL
ncbi:hypothetical protein HDU96_003485, partial [Phlyctochytrium bullatum]